MRCYSSFAGCQAAGAVHLGVDNLNVVRQVRRLMDGNIGSWPVELVKDGDLILLIDRILGGSAGGRRSVLLRFWVMLMRAWFREEELVSSTG